MCRNFKYCTICQGNSKETTILSEQNVLYGSASTPTPYEELINEETYKNSNNNCYIVEQRPKIVEQNTEAQWMMDSMEVLD